MRGRQTEIGVCYYCRGTFFLVSLGGLRGDQKVAASPAKSGMFDGPVGLFASDDLLKKRLRSFFSLSVTNLLVNCSLCTQ